MKLKFPHALKITNTPTVLSPQNYTLTESIQSQLEAGECTKTING